ncbi:MAG: DUF3788 family protein [Candidatus Stygibacter australis]|nr:DUF3788 family protein [Candidatus Stygibacter australis]MDP8322156.1 DUF3788 family protein [Candidatus Stygibacter australis]
MEKPLNDKNVFPDDEVLSKYLEVAKTAWDSFLESLQFDHPDFNTEWRYYKDGKSWLFKITKKKKTICWVSVGDKMFRTTFYFSDKAEDMLKSSKLKPEFIDQFMNGKRYGKIRGLTIEIRTPADLEVTNILIEIKEKLK